MELRRFIDVLWKRLWLILLATVLVTGMTFYLSIISTPIYQASATLAINQGANPTTDVYGTFMVGQRLAATYVEQIKSPVILKKAIDKLQLNRPLAEVTDSVTVQQVRDTQLVQVSVQDANPALAQALANTLADVFIQQISESQQARFQTSLDDLNKQIAELESSIAAAQRAITALGIDPTTSYRDPKSFDNLSEFARAEFAQRQIELTRDQTRLVTLLKSREDFRLAMTRYTDNITVFSPAELPKAPVSPRTALNVVLGLISGLVLGVSTAFLLEYLDDTLKTPEDVSQALGLTTLATVSRLRDIKDLSDGLVAARSPRLPAVEAYRLLRTNLKFVGLGNPSGSLVVTSASPTEGKTTTLANLGVVMAQGGKQVLLVDGDLRRPTLHKMFDLRVEPGLTDVLLGNVPDADAAIQPTPVEGLSILSCGARPPNPAELLDSPQMKQLIQQLKGKADLVLFDSPPALAVTDAGLLATQTDRTLLVIDCGETRRDAARRAKESLDKIGARIAGVVLNRMVPGRGYGDYDYHYYYDSETGERKRGRRGKNQPSA